MLQNSPESTESSCKIFLRHRSFPLRAIVSLQNRNPWDRCGGTKWCAADPGPFQVEDLRGSGSAAHLAPVFKAPETRNQEQFNLLQRRGSNRQGNPWSKLMASL